MTSFVNQNPASVFGDTLTTTNNGQGLSPTVLQPVQDAFGNSSPMNICQNAVNFNRTDATFQLDAVPLTASAANINSICGGTPNFGSMQVMTLPKLSSDPGGGSTGNIYYNTTSNVIRAFLQGIGWVTLNHTP